MRVTISMRNIRKLNIFILIKDIENLSGHERKQGPVTYCRRILCHVLLLAP
jgi:hypothetical protein